MPDSRFDGLDFVDDRERTYFAQAKVGEDFIEFLSSSQGRYLHGCAKQAIEEYRTALEEYTPASFFRRKKQERELLELQQKCLSARFFMTWCAEAIQNGEAAWAELKTYRENDQ